MSHFCNAPTDSTLLRAAAQTLTQMRDAGWLMHYAAGEFDEGEPIAVLLVRNRPAAILNALVERVGNDAGVIEASAEAMLLMGECTLLLSQGQDAEVVAKVREFCAKPSCLYSNPPGATH